jgi:hypothetical protein
MKFSLLVEKKLRRSRTETPPYENLSTACMAIQQHLSDFLSTSSFSKPPFNPSVTLDHLVSLAATTQRTFEDFIQDLT